MVHIMPDFSKEGIPHDSNQVTPQWNEDIIALIMAFL